MSKNKRYKKVIIGTLAGVLCLFFALSAIAFGELINNQSQSHPKSDTAREEITADTLYLATNQLRHEAGSPLLSLEPRLNTSATQKCDDMVVNKYYGHENPTTHKKGYTYIFDNLDTNGGYGSENLNDGNLTDTAGFMQSWLNSPPHKAAMLDPKYTSVGFAVCHIPSEPSDYRTVVMHLAQVKDKQ